MKYASKHEAKKWSMSKLGHGGLVATIPTPFTDDLKARPKRTEPWDGVRNYQARNMMRDEMKKGDGVLFYHSNCEVPGIVGIAKVARRTLAASGAGTVGYIAPEQAMGKPSLRSDVFSLGLLLYRMFSGYLPEWPFTWPPLGFDRVRKTLHPELIARFDDWLGKTAP